MYSMHSTIGMETSIQQVQKDDWTSSVQLLRRKKCLQNIHESMSIMCLNKERLREMFDTWLLTTIRSESPLKRSKKTIESLIQPTNWFHENFTIEVQENRQKMVRKKENNLE